MLEVSKLATASGRMVMEAIAATIAETFPWDDDRSARGALAILHEVLHLQQDLTTGVGAWDHLVTRDAFVVLTAQTKWFVSRFDSPPYSALTRSSLADLGDRDDFTQQVEDSLDAIEEQTIGYRQLRGATWATDDARTAVETLYQRTLDNDFIDGQSLRRLLEGEAACSVHQQLRRSKTSDKGLEILEQYEELWNVPKMTDVYSSTLVNVAWVMANGPPDPEHLAAALDFYLFTVAWLTDLAFAHPPPAMIRSLDHDRVLFDPVVRYLYLLRALGDLDESSTAELFRALTAGEEDDAEHRLLSACAIDYPTSRAVYEQWVKELERLCLPDAADGPLLQLRVDAIKHRLATGHAKGVTNVLEARTPVSLLVDDYGLTELLEGRHLLDEEVKAQLRLALMMNDVDVELYDLFHGDGSFQCFLGRAANCSSRRDQCVTGITDVGQLPGAAGCYIRRELTGLGYSI